jgi:hypothetical protein
MIEGQTAPQGARAARRVASGTPQRGGVVLLPRSLAAGGGASG